MDDIVVVGPIVTTRVFPDELSRQRFTGNSLMMLSCFHKDGDFAVLPRGVVAQIVKYVNAPPKRLTVFAEDYYPVARRVEVGALQRQNWRLQLQLRKQQSQLDKLMRRVAALEDN